LINRHFPNIYIIKTTYPILLGGLGPDYIMDLIRPGSHCMYNQMLILEINKLLFFIDSPVFIKLFSKCIIEIIRFSKF